MNDLVDDLHAAEDMIGTAHVALEQVVAFAEQRPWTGLADAAGYPQFESLLSNLKYAASSSGTYCRPSCGANGDPHSDECDDDTCGCPCGHVEKLHEEADAEREHEAADAEAQARHDAAVDARDDDPFGWPE